ncbi:MAG: hypothetical protein U1F35_16215 [Steroidobacteraceae bacterium]
MRRLILAMLLACCATAVAAADLEPTEFLDERTGATVTVTHEPLVFALERSIFAANARDYVSLTAAEVDRSGRIQVYLIAYIWSTIDRRNHGEQATLAALPLEIAADGRTIRLNPIAQYPKDLLDDAHLMAPKASHLQRAAYLTTREALTFIAASRHVSASFVPAAADGEEEADTEREVYESWGEGRKALKAFADRLTAFQ